MDVRAASAREHHREAGRLMGQAARRRLQRDHLIRILRAEDPEEWTYVTLAKVVGCSPELVAHIVRSRSQHALDSQDATDDV